MRIVKLNAETKKDLLKNLLKRSPSNFDNYAETVQEIVDDVRDNGDAALFSYTKKFDKADITAENVKVTQKEIDYAYTQVSPELLDVIRKAKKNIWEYHVYVPGGKAVYPSSVLMNVMPAKVAGVEKIVMTTPCNAEGEVYATTLVAAKEAGVDEIYKAGGAQAIAALAYGTESVPKVDKIVGPGNIFVALAKRAVY